MLPLADFFSIDWCIDRDHISLRLSGNIGIQPNSTLDTLGHFFDIHDRIHGTHPKKILQGPASVKLPSPAIYLEGFISVKDASVLLGSMIPKGLP